MTGVQTCALPISTTNYSVVCWGDNSEGQLGTSLGGTESSGQEGSDGEAIFVELPRGFNAAAVAAGTAHACAAGLDGRLVCWGRNTDGQLGMGNESAKELPGYADLPQNESVSEISIGADHSCVTTMSGKLFCWGNGSDGRNGAMDTGGHAYQYENFSDDSRSWTSSHSSYYKGPAQGYDYLYRTDHNSWQTRSMTSDDSFELEAGDNVS